MQIFRKLLMLKSGFTFKYFTSLFYTAFYTFCEISKFFDEELVASGDERFSKEQNELGKSGHDGGHGLFGRRT